MDASSIKQPVSWIWADRLRNIAIVMVVAIHVAAPVAHAPIDLNTLWWWAGNFWDSLSRPGVPLFVMLSGFLLLGKDYPLTDFLKRRFSRVMIPALFWMGVYSLYGHIANNSPATVWDMMHNIIVRPVHYHLWFIYLIIGLYLVYPILRAWVRTASEQDFRYFFIMCMIGAWLNKIMIVFFQLPIGIYFELFTNNCGYFVLGYYLGAKGTADMPSLSPGLPAWKWNNRQLIRLGFALVLAGTVATMLGTYWLNFNWVQGTEFNVYFYDYLTPNVGIGAIGWFLLVRFGCNRLALLDIEKEFAAASFGVYFAHVLVMDWWGQCGYWHSGQHPAKGIPILLAMVLSMTFLVVSLIRVLPWGKKIT